jgi:hypothetical protein
MQRQPATTGLQIRVNRGRGPLLPGVIDPGTAWPCDRAQVLQWVPAEYLRPVSRPGGTQIDGSSGPRKYTFLYKCTSGFSSVLSACAARAAMQQHASVRRRARAAAARARWDRGIVSSAARCHIVARARRRYTAAHTHRRAICYAEPQQRCGWSVCYSTSVPPLSSLCQLIVRLLPHYCRQQQPTRRPTHWRPKVAMALPTTTIITGQHQQHQHQH